MPCFREAGRGAGKLRSGGTAGRRSALLRRGNLRRRRTHPLSKPLDLAAELEIERPRPGEPGPVPIAVAQDHVLFQRLEIDQLAYVATRVLDGSLDLALLQLVSLDPYAGGPKAVPTSFERSVGIAIVLQILLEVGVVVEGHAVALE